MAIFFILSVFPASSKRLIRFLPPAAIPGVRHSVCGSSPRERRSPIVCNNTGFGPGIDRSAFSTSSVVVDAPSSSSRGRRSLFSIIFFFFYSLYPLFLQLCLARVYFIMSGIFKCNSIVCAIGFYYHYFFFFSLMPRTVAVVVVVVISLRVKW